MKKYTDQGKVGSGHNLVWVLLSVFALLVTACCEVEHTPELLAKLSYDVNGKHFEEENYYTIFGNRYWDSMPVKIEIQDGFQFKKTESGNIVCTFFYSDGEGMLYLSIPGNADGLFELGREYNHLDGIKASYYPRSLVSQKEINLVSASIIFDYSKKSKTSKSGYLYLQFSFTEEIINIDKDDEVISIMVSNGLYYQKVTNSIAYFKL